jgi:hypothetical protein
MYCKLHTDRGTATELYCDCYEDGGRIVQGTVMCTDRGTANERYFVCYEDGGRMEQGTVICTQTEELQLNVTLFVLRTA